MGHDAHHDGEGPAYVTGGIVGGLALGVPTALLNCCCFVFGPIGGVIAAWVAARRATSFGAQEGAIAAACAGAIGWLVQAVISVPLVMAMPKFFQNNPQLLQGIPPQFRQLYTQPADIGMIVMSQGMTLGVLLVTAVIGGVLAGQTFLRRDPYELRYRQDPYAQPSVPGPPGSGEKACPQCGETIKAAAVKCRFCGSSIGGGPPAQ